nr:RNA-directed DNA polymerase, eukaryota [Tanacetum cinerariifolium]
MLFDFAMSSAQGRSRGDFNEVRFALERYGTIFHASHDDIFNSFITDSHLIDVPLGGYSFTWSNKHTRKMSKSDWFLISEGLFKLFLNLSDAWNNVVVYDLNAMEFDHKELHDKLNDIDSRLNKREGLHDDVYNRADVFCKIDENGLKNSTDMAQKAKIKWAIEGDKNSKFFHAIVNKKCRQQAIKGILVDDSIRVPLDGKIPRCLEADFSNQLEEEVSNVEIKNTGLRQGDPLSPFCSFWSWKVIMYLSNGSLIELGVKVRANMAHISSWNIVVQKVKSELSSWKAKTLSVEGRLTLIKSVLGALLTYYMSLFRVSDGVLNQLEGLHNSFFLGSDIGDRKMNDRWSWSLNGDGVFSVKSAREVTDNHVLANSTSTTRWSKLLPIKVNVFAWRMFLDKLSTRLCLSNRALEALIFSLWWHIWSYRTALLFSMKKPKKDLIFNNIVSQTWLWVLLQEFKMKEGCEMVKIRDGVGM